MKAVSDMVIAVPHETSQLSAGGIYMPTMPQRTMTVVACGPDTKTVKDGDVVLVPAANRSERTFDLAGTTYTVFPEMSILGVL